MSTIAALRQWISWAMGAEARRPILAGRFAIFDPFRASIEPNGFAGPDGAVREPRFRATRARKVVEHADYFVFTQHDRMDPLLEGTRVLELPGTMPQYRQRRLPSEDLFSRRDRYGHDLDREDHLRHQSEARFLFPFWRFRPRQPHANRSRSSKRLPRRPYCVRLHASPRISMRSPTTFHHTKSLRAWSLESLAPRRSILWDRTPGLGSPLTIFSAISTPPPPTRKACRAPAAGRVRWTKSGRRRGFLAEIQKMRSDLKGIF